MCRQILEVAANAIDLPFQEEIKAAMPTEFAAMQKKLRALKLLIVD